MNGDSNASSPQNLQRMGSFRHASSDYRTKMCWFSSRGKCSRGSSCHFAHCSEDLRTGRRDNKPSGRLCRHFSRGWCRLGSKCRFQHLPAKATLMLPPLEQPAMEPFPLDGEDASEEDEEEETEDGEEYEEEDEEELEEQVTHLQVDVIEVELGSASPAAGSTYSARDGGAVIAPCRLAEPPSLVFGESTKLTAVSPSVVSLREVVMTSPLARIIDGYDVIVKNTFFDVEERPSHESRRKRRERAASATP
eukprot:TRINITY_DN16805_c0_g1_i1.p2 TRINITY_DN16805_c0_g1~~TRINITY_DN16805_c0_g1_i1.p2  ORF type:complete len:270 (-),score=62.70 TRINITY_DN16805_c0_g1_i1:852-1601(-)